MTHDEHTRWTKFLDTMNEVFEPDRFIAMNYYTSTFTDLTEGIKEVLAPFVEDHAKCNAYTKSFIESQLANFIGRAEYLSGGICFKTLPQGKKPIPFESLRVEFDKHGVLTLHPQLTLTL